MLISRWFRRTRRPVSSYQPMVCVLEDRTVPALVRPLPRVPVPPPATHLEVVMPQFVEAGKAFKVVIQAEDAKHKVVPSFRGTVQVSLAVSDPTALFPTSFTFSAADKGKHSIQMTLTTTGTQKVMAVSGTRFGQAIVTVNGPVTHFAIHAPAKANAYAAVPITVTALDANNQIVPGYTGTVRLTSTDPIAALPTDYKFQAGDKGTHVYYLTTFYTTGVHTLTARDLTNSSITGSDQIQILSPWYYPSYGGMYGGMYGYPYGAWYTGWGYPWW